MNAIAEGDGDFVEIRADISRDQMIIKDLIEMGAIAIIGKPLLSGGGSYRITSLGENRLEYINAKLIAEEVETSPAPTQSNALVLLWRHKKSVFSILAAKMAFIWLLFSQILAPSRYCLMLPTEITSWFAPCEGIVNAADPIN